MIAVLRGAGPASTTTGICAAVATSAAPIHDAAWNAELDAAGRWLDGLPVAGEIVELAAGTGWWSPLLAAQGRAVAVRRVAARRSTGRASGSWRMVCAPTSTCATRGPSRTARSTALFAGFWLSHVPRERLPAFLALVRRWLKPGGAFAFIDSLPDPQSGAADHPAPADDRLVRRLADGREFAIVKVYYAPAELEAALARRGLRGGRRDHDGAVLRARDAAAR